VYVNTPHISNEAFRFAQRAFERGDIASALTYIQQARQVSPDAPDIPYFLGEIYRQQGDYKRAQDAYAAALAIDPNFAPAQLGNAQAEMALDSKADVAAELRQAIQNDPNLQGAYLELANYLIAHGEAQQALDLLNQASGLLADSPLLYLRRVEAELALGKGAEAYEDAVKANQLDQTLLESYRLLGQAAARTVWSGQVRPGAGIAEPGAGTGQEATRGPPVPRSGADGIGTGSSRGQRDLPGITV
jgi:tetratricopeptide (TPR) repeat protein